MNEAAHKAFLRFREKANYYRSAQAQEKHGRATAKERHYTCVRRMTACALYACGLGWSSMERIITEWTATDKLRCQQEIGEIAKPPKKRPTR